MVEQRRIPQVERLESRDVPSALGVPYLAPPFPLGTPPAIGTPQVVVLTPTTQVAASEPPVARDLVTPVLAAETRDPLAEVWQQSVDAVFSRLAEHSDPVSIAWTQPAVERGDPSPVGVTASEHPACAAANPLAAAAVSSPPQPAPTITNVHRYASRSVSRHRLEDPDDAVQQICLEWLLLAGTVATTFDDVRRIVARVIDRAYWRLKKKERAVELLDVPVHADRVADAFRDMQLDRDLGVKDLTDREWQVVELRRQGYTFVEIGERVGMRKQRAREMFNLAVSYLRRRYRE